MSNPVCIMCSLGLHETDRIYVENPTNGRAICESCVHLCAVLIRDKKASNGGEYGCDTSEF